MPVNAHPDSTFSSHVHNDWTLLQLDSKLRGPSGGNGSVGSNHDVTSSDNFPQNHFPTLEMPPKEGKEGEADAAPKKAEAPEEEKKDANELKEEAKAEAAPEGASSVLENRPKKKPSKSEKGASTMALDNLNL